jgi:hypothetical protein
MFATSFIYGVLTVRLMRRHVRINVVRLMMGPVFVAAASSIVARLIVDAVDPPFLGLVSSMAAGTTLYLALMFAMRTADVRAVFAAVNLARRRDPAAA